MNLPNKLTILRVVMIPLFVLCFLDYRIPNHFFWAFLLFAAASLTDMLDGYLARKWNLVTDFGKLMDPLADKLLVISALILLLNGGCNLIISPLLLGPTFNQVCLIVIMAREFIVTALRQLAVEKGVVIAADKWGKFKTISQMVWISMALLGFSVPWGRFSPLFDAVYWQIAGGLFLLMIALTVFSGVNYIWKNRHLFADK